MRRFAISHDLAQLAAADFLEGSGAAFRQTAAIVTADAPRRQRERMASAVGDLEKRERAGNTFTPAIMPLRAHSSRSFSYPVLATKTEREMLRLAQAHTR